MIADNLNLLGLLITSRDLGLDSDIVPCYARQACINSVPLFSPFYAPLFMSLLDTIHEYKVLKR